MHAGTVVRMRREIPGLGRHDEAICRGWVIAKSRTRVSEINSSS